MLFGQFIFVPSGVCNGTKFEQESPAVADKPARRKSMPKLLQFDVKTSCRQVHDLFEVMEFDLTFLKYRNLVMIQRVINKVDRVRGL